MTSPAKPWERQRSTNGTLSALDQRLAERNRLPLTKAATSTSATRRPTNTLSSDTQQPPALPRRPSTLNSVVNRNASAYSPYARNPYSTIGGPYGGAGYSPYNRFGANSMYGGGMYGGGMYGGGMYGGMGGMPGGGMYGNNGQMGLTESMNQSTQATFQMIESLVGAFGGFAQMLESTYMATHSSFFAMVSVAEQFSNLKTTLGSLLGIFTILRYLRTLLAKLTGRPPPADATSLTPSSFQNFLSPGSSQNKIMTTGPYGQPVQSHKPSRKPLMIFLLAIFGLPYLMGKLIKALSSQQNSEQPSSGYPVLGPNGLPLPYQPLPEQQLDPSQLTFCRALFDYTPPNTLQPTTGGEKDLPLQKGDLVAILFKVDPITSQPSEWWKCRSRKGDVGWVPGSYLEEIQRRPAIESGKKDQEGGGHSRVSTMTTADPVSDKEEEGGSRSTTMTSVSSGDNEGPSTQEKGKAKAK